MEGFVRARLIWMAEGCECSIELFVPVGWCRLEGLFDPIVIADAGCLALRLSVLRLLRSFEVFVGLLLRSFDIFVVEFAECFGHSSVGFGFLGHALLGGFLALVERSKRVIGGCGILI